MKVADLVQHGQKAWIRRESKHHDIIIFVWHWTAWTGLLDWTTGLDYWTGLLDWTTAWTGLLHGLDYCMTGLLHDWTTGLTIESK